MKHHDHRNARRRHGGIAALATATLIAACGSNSPGSSGASASSNRAQARRDGLSFARCMRSHGVPRFPDPTPNSGAIDLNAAGINASSAAFTAAQAACKGLQPLKHVPSRPPTAQAYARLLHWTRCLREHGISGLPDPKPDPPPAPGSAETAGIGTLMGDGGYWVGIPATIDAHSPAFARLSTACGESPGGHSA